MTAAPRLLITLFAASAGVALAQGLPERIQGLAPSVRAVPPAPSAPAPEASLEKRIAEARAELARLSSADADAPPPGVTREQWIELRATVERTLLAYESQFETERNLTEARRRHAALEGRSRAWTGFPAPPPYSILLIDELRGALAAARERVYAADSKRRLARVQADAEHERLERARAAVRRAVERVAAASGAERAAATFALELADRQARDSAALVGLTDAVQRLAAEQAAEARDEVMFIERQLKVASASITFPRPDLDRVLARIAAEHRDLERGGAYARSSMETRSKALDAARSELDAARRAVSRPGDPPDLPGRLTRLGRIEALRAIQVESANVGYDLIRARLDLNNLARTTWESRFAAANTSDPAQKRATYENVTRLLERIQPWREYIANELRVVRGRVAQAERQIGLAATPDDARAARDLLEAWREREAMHASAQAALERERSVVERWKEEFEGERGVRPWWSRASNAWYASLSFARAVWDFELIAAEDTFEIDGRRITATRSVTVGKSVGVIALLVLGFPVVSWLVRWLERTMVARLRVDPGVARITRRWLQVFLVAALAVIALDVVKIPLTVFAFVGGALAIGFGFGAQSLLKNLMSGIMLLLERPLKVGDIVEMGHIVGRVTNISIRASTIRSANGIETLVPNSTLIESNLTNWTHSSTSVRRDIKVGVAYGSDTRKVSDTLLTVADRHGQVLKNPAPRVIFEDFGSDALAFTLEFWIDYAKGADSRQIASDLRFMIEKALAEAGIGIPFPQRDVHLYANRPLQVEVVSQAAVPGPREADRG